MWVFRALGLFTCYGLWRVTGIQALGRVIVAALGSQNENIRSIAGIFLVKARRQSEPLVEQALRHHKHLPIVLTILADIGDRRMEDEIRELSADRDPKIAEAAKQALRVLAMNR
jgi:hypothetical protein